MDPRNIKYGNAIPSEGYCDQPYIVKNSKGQWVCVITTGQGEEGSSGQHIVSMISSDKGKSWSNAVDIEPSSGPEASWALPLAMPGGRIYIFYTYNKDNIRKVICDKSFRKEGYTTRVDSLGAMVYKYSDDGGLSWSQERYEIPIRKMKCDYENDYSGEIMYFWGVGKPIIHEDAVYIGFSKVGKFGRGFMQKSEACFLKSSNILGEKDPSKLKWETLPDGEEGLKSPGGPVSDEANLVGLSDGSLYCTYRTIDGYPCHAYSRDGGHNWTRAEYMTYVPGGRKIKHPRAANFVWKCSNGKYLYWFHNHGIENDKWPGPRPNAYKDRNPAWLLAGTEIDSPEGKIIHWSQPEIVLYDYDPLIRMSYPCLIEDDGKYYLSETQKESARIHQIPENIIEKLFAQDSLDNVCFDGVVFEKSASQGAEISGQFKCPVLPEFGDYDLSKYNYPTKKINAGFTVEFWCKFRDTSAGQILLDTRSEHDIGIVIKTGENNSISIGLFDGRTLASWQSNNDVVGSDELHHFAIIVDGGPRIISFVVDGELNDGGSKRQFGWGRFSKYFYSLNHSEHMEIAPSFNGIIKLMRIYDRAVLVSEAVGNFRAGCDAVSYK